MTPRLARYDQSDLLHLALDAGRHGAPGAALPYLMEAVQRRDSTAAVHFLLGSEYARARMTDHAIAEMESALARAPAFLLARLRLALLLAARGETGPALEALLPLPEGDDPTLLIARGLRRLLRGEHAAALRDLSRGLSCAGIDAGLASDVRAVLDTMPSALRRLAIPKSRLM